MRGFGFFLELELWLLLYLVFAWWPLIQEKLRYFLLALTAAASLVSIYGLLQVAGLDFYEYEIFDPVRLRAASTLGQPNYLAAYLLFSLAFSWWGYLVTKSKLKFLYLISWLLQLLTLVFTLSRSGWLGLFAAVLVSFIFYLRQFKAKKWILYSVCLLTFLLLAMTAGFLITKNTASENIFINYSSVGNRVLSTFSLNQGTYRFGLYRSGLDLISKKPLLGYGQDTQELYLYRYYNGSWAIVEAINANPDRLHNIFLDFIFESGLVTFSVALILAWFVLRVIKQAYKTRLDLQEQKVVKLLLLALLGFLVSLLFSFITIVTASYLALTLGIILALVSERQVITLGQRSYYLIIILPFLGYLSFIYIQGIMASHYFRQLNLARNQNDYLVWANKITVTAPSNQFEGFYRAELLATTLSYLDSGVIDKNAFDLLLKKILNTDNEPQTFRAKLSTLMVLTRLLPPGLPSGQSQLFLLINDKFSQLKKNTGGYALVELAWGDLNYRVGDFSRAIIHYNNAIKLYPNTTDKMMNLEHRTMVIREEKLVYKKSADTSIMLGQLDMALEYIKTGKRLDPMDVDWLKLEIEVYKTKGDKLKVKSLHKAGSKLFPQDDYFKVS
ncbi:MAG: O-antigen ligase family protein [bacterium]